MRSGSELSAVLVGPNRALALQLKDALDASPHFRVVEDLTHYPTPVELEASLQQKRPDAVLIDLSSDVERAVSLIGVAAAMQPPVHAIAVNSSEDAGLIIRAMRSGSAEFLSPPFAAETLAAAANRLKRLAQAGRPAQSERGRAVAFVAAKSGQGVTTTASNVAAAIAAAGKRVALLDFDMSGSTLSFCWRVSHTYSVLDAVQNAEKLDEALWGALVANRNGVDLLLAPETPEILLLQGDRYVRLLEFARSLYEVVVLDIPSAYQSEAKALLPECDSLYVVCNPELPSLHLTRKLIAYLEQEGFSRDQFSLIVNRMSRKQELGAQDIERVFNYPIGRSFPEDDGAVHRALTAGKPVPPSCELGRSFVALGQELAGADESKSEKKKASSGLSFSALLSQG